MGVSATDRRIVGGHETTFIIEETLPGYLHACTTDGVVRVLAALPPEDCAGIQTIVFQQITRKQQLLSPRWGQMTFGVAGVDGVAHEATISLIAAQANQAILWPASIVPADAAELDRLKQDGHDVHVTRRGWEIVSTLAAVRRTQLSRTIPHEVGHWVDYRACVARGDNYDSRPHASKEAFAEQYAAKMQARVVAALAQRVA